MNDNINSDSQYEDIQSSSLPRSASSLRAATKNYGNGIFRSLDKIVKTISFFLSIVVLLIFAAAAAVLVYIDEAFLVIAICVFIAGILFSAITLFLIFAIGHLISQNNEIIKRL